MGTFSLERRGLFGCVLPVSTYSETDVHPNLPVIVLIVEDYHRSLVANGAPKSSPPDAY